MIYGIGHLVHEKHDISRVHAYHKGGKVVLVFGSLRLEILEIEIAVMMDLDGNDLETSEMSGLEGAAVCQTSQKYLKRKNYNYARQDSSHEH